MPNSNIVEGGANRGGRRTTKYLVASTKFGKVVHYTPPVPLIRCPLTMLLVFLSVRCTSHSLPVAVGAFCAYLHNLGQFQKFQEAHQQVEHAFTLKQRFQSTTASAKSDIL